MNTRGTLYAVGVGPGDPELVTVKAVKILERTKYLFTATSGPNKKSLALSIASSYLKNNPRIILLSFPMVRDKEVLEKAWQTAALKVIEVLKEGHDATFVTLGDPSTYSTFTYLLRSITNKDPLIKIQVIPGITSFQAAAAKLKIPLAEGEESLTIVSGAKGGREIEQAIGHCDNMVVMKAYRHYEEIIETLEKLGLVDKTVGARRIGLEGESITKKLHEWDGKKPSYFTLLITKKGGKGKKLHQ